MKDNKVRVRNTPVIHLKDKKDRHFKAIHLKNQFGFVPEIIIVEKSVGQNNRFVVRAVMTKEEIDKEEKLKAEFEKKKKGGVKNGGDKTKSKL